MNYPSNLGNTELNSKFCIIVLYLARGITEVPHATMGRLQTLLQSLDVKV